MDHVTLVPKAVLGLPFALRIRDKVQSFVFGTGGLTFHLLAALTVAPGSGILDLPVLFLMVPGTRLGWGWTQAVIHIPSGKAPVGHLSRTSFLDRIPVILRC